MTKAQTLKGFRDFLPQEASKRQWLKDIMRQVFEKWGYEPLETPTLESLDLFEGQIGEDEKLFYKFEDPGGRHVALMTCCNSSSGGTEAKHVWARAPPPTPAPDRSSTAHVACVWPYGLARKGRGRHVGVMYHVLGVVSSKVCDRVYSSLDCVPCLSFHSCRQLQEKPLGCDTHWR